MTKLSQRPRMFWALVLSYLAVLLPLLMGFLFYSQIRGIAVEQALDNGQKTIDRVQSEMDLRLRELRLLADQTLTSRRVLRFHYAASPAMGHDAELAVDVISELKTLKQVTPFVDDFFVYYPYKGAVFTPGALYDSELYYRTVCQLPGQSCAQWEAMLNQNSYLGEFLAGGMVSAGEEYITYLQTNQISGYPKLQVGILLSRPRIEATLSSLVGIPGSSLYLLDNHHRLIAQSGDAPISRYFSWDGAAVDPGLSPLPGQEVLVLSQFSQLSNWTYLLVIPQTELMQQVHLIQNWMIITTLCSLTLGLIATVLLSRTTYRPVKRLVGAVHDLMPGQPVDAQPDEMRLIAGALTQMHELNQRMSRSVEAQREMVRTNLLSRLLKRPYHADPAFADLMEAYGLHFSHTRFVVFQARGATFEQNPALSQLEDWKLVRFVILNVLEEGAGAVGECFLGDAEEDAIVGIVNLRDGMDSQEAVKRLRGGLEQALQVLEDNFQMEIKLCLGGVHAGLEGIHPSFLESERLLEFLLLQGGDLMSQEDLRNYDRSYDFTLDTELKLVNLVKNGQREETQRLLHAIIDVNFQERNLSEAAMRCLLFEIASTAFKLIREMGIDAKAVEALGNISIEQFLSGLSTHKLRGVLLTLYDCLCAHIAQHKNQHNEQLFASIQNYIDQHYTDPNFSQRLMADDLGLSVPYLSVFFKSYTGEKMVDHLCRRRVAHAKRLLVATSLTLEDIAQQSGCSSSIALIRLFKRLEGITPGQYRESHAHQPPTAPNA